MRVVHLVIVIGWVLFCAYWLLAALSAKASRPGGIRLGGLPVVVVLVAFFLARSSGLGSRPARGDPVLAGVGLALFVLGLAFAIWARVYLGRNWGRPMTRREEPELVTAGPYRRVRHPIYTGLITAMLGSALATRPWGLIVVAALAAYFVVSSVREESFLASEFPDTYPAYRKSTKMLIPFVF